MATRRYLLLFLIWLAIVLGAVAFKVWQNNEAAKRETANAAAEQRAWQAAVAMVHALGPRGGKIPTRQEFEALLLDPKPVAISHWKNPETGETVDNYTYHDPHTGARIIVNFLNNVWHGASNGAGIDPVGTPPPVRFTFGEEVRRRVDSSAGWVWAAVFVWLLWAKPREQRVARSLLMLGIAIAFAAAALTVPFRRSYLYPDTNGFWGLILIAISFGAVILAWQSRVSINPLICGTCGYDLRASPLRCPECGTPAPQREFTSPAKPPADRSPPASPFC